MFERRRVLAIAGGTATLFFLALSQRALTQAPPGPSAGWTVHIDAKKHFGDAHPDEIAHHWCKNVAGMTECQIYDSDGADAHLVAVETIVSPATYRSMDAREQAMWHYHKDELAKVDAVMPGMSADDAAKLTAQISDTYGKVWVLWDPASATLPVGRPSVTIMK